MTRIHIGLRRICAGIACWALAVAAGLTAPAFADLTVKGDAAAWREVTAAYGKLNALPGYRIKTAVRGGGNMVMEVAPAANAMRSLIQMPNGNVEAISVGGEVRLRTTMPGSPPGWRCSGIPPMPRSGDPTAYQGTVDVARGPDVTIDGKAMRVYTYTHELPPGTAPGLVGSGSVKTTLYVGVENGLPRRAVLDAAQGDQVLDFYDYGAPIQITLPPCGGA